MLIDYGRDRLLSTFGIQTLEDRYLIEGESSPQDAFARAAKAFADDESHAQRLYDYASNLWFMFSVCTQSNNDQTLLKQLQTIANVYEILDRETNG